MNGAPRVSKWTTLRMRGGPHDGDSVAYLGQWPPLRYRFYVPVFESPGAALEDVYRIDGHVGGEVNYRYLGRILARP